MDIGPLSIVRCNIIPFLFRIGFCFLVTASDGQAESLPESWSIDLRGSLKKTIRLGSIINKDDGFVYQIGCRHQIAYNLDDEPLSTWLLAGLRTHIEIDPFRRVLIWHRPNGGATLVKLSVSEIDPERLAGRVSAIIIGNPIEGSCEIFDADGLIWSYRAGSLEELGFPSGRKWRYKCRGANIERIDDINGSATRTLLVARWTAFGQLQSLSIPGERCHFGWGADSQITTIQGSLGMTRITYVDGLVTNISRTGEAEEKFSWRRLSPKAAKRLPQPIVLTSDNLFSYIVKPWRSGIRIDVLQNGREKALVKYNSVNGALSIIGH